MLDQGKQFLRLNLFFILKKKIFSFGSKPFFVEVAENILHLKLFFTCCLALACWYTVRYISEWIVAHNAPQPDCN